MNKNFQNIKDTEFDKQQFSVFDIDKQNSTTNFRAT